MIEASGHTVRVRCDVCGVAVVCDAEFEATAWRRVRSVFVVNRTKRYARCRSAVNCKRRVEASTTPNQRGKR